LHTVYLSISLSTPKGNCAGHDDYKQIDAVLQWHSRGEFVIAWDDDRMPSEEWKGFEPTVRNMYSRRACDRPVLLQSTNYWKAIGKEELSANSTEALLYYRLTAQASAPPCLQLCGNSFIVAILGRSQARRLHILRTIGSKPFHSSSGMQSSSQAITNIPLLCH